MKNDRGRWNEKYLRKSFSNDLTPDDKMCCDYLLNENELLHAFLSLRVLFYQELKQNRHGETRWTASLVAEK